MDAFAPMEQHLVVEGEADDVAIAKRCAARCMELGESGTLKCQGFMHAKEPSTQLGTTEPNTCVFFTDRTGTGEASLVASKRTSTLTSCNSARRTIDNIGTITHDASSSSDRTTPMAHVLST